MIRGFPARSVLPFKENLLPERFMVYLVEFPSNTNSNLVIFPTVSAQKSHRSLVVPVVRFEPAATIRAVIGGSFTIMVSVRVAARPFAVARTVIVLCPLRKVFPSNRHVLPPSVVCIRYWVLFPQKVRVTVLLAGIIWSKTAVKSHESVVKPVLLGLFEVKEVIMIS